MKVVFKDYQGNQVYTAELAIDNSDMLVIEPVPIMQPRNPLEAVNQLMERSNSIYPRMKLYTISGTEDNITN